MSLVVKLFSVCFNRQDWSTTAEEKKRFQLVDQDVHFIHLYLAYKNNRFHVFKGHRLLRRVNQVLGN
jgi:hypothetical protein